MFKNFKPLNQAETALASYNNAHLKKRMSLGTEQVRQSLIEIKLNTRLNHIAQQHLTQSECDFFLNIITHTSRNNHLMITTHETIFNTQYEHLESFLLTLVERAVLLAPHDLMKKFYPKLHATTTLSCKIQKLLQKSEMATLKKHLRTEKEVNAPEWKEKARSLALYSYNADALIIMGVCDTIDVTDLMKKAVQHYPSNHRHMVAHVIFSVYLHRILESEKFSDVTFVFSNE